jgi:hypothetical protein
MRASANPLSLRVGPYKFHRVSLLSPVEGLSRPGQNSPYARVSQAQPAARLPSPPPPLLASWRRRHCPPPCAAAASRLPALPPLPPPDAAVADRLPAQPPLTASRCHRRRPSPGAAASGHLIPAPLSRSTPRRGLRSSPGRPPPSAQLAAAPASSSPATRMLRSCAVGAPRVHQLTRDADEGGTAMDDVDAQLAGRRRPVHLPSCWYVLTLSLGCSLRFSV